MSVPLTKALSPAPRRMTTRTAASASSRSHRSCSPSYIGNVMALRASGRLTVTTATRSARSSVRCSAMVSIMALTIAHLANFWDHGAMFRLSRARDVVVSAQPDEALLASVAVLRHLGARITRYDPQAGTLEARLRRFLPPAPIRPRAQAGGEAPRGRGEGAAPRRAPRCPPLPGRPA